MALYHHSISVMLVLMATMVPIVYVLENGLARMPPMGWLTWERFRCVTDCSSYPENCISERLIRAQADRLSADGYLKAGYQYIIVDDCWSNKTRDKQGRLQADAKRFPSGMKALVNYVHAKGLRFGIYADYGTLTCGGYPGSLGHETIDALTFADWGIDYVKLDGCYSSPSIQPKGYADFGAALNKTGRPMVYSCSYPAYGFPKDAKHLQTICNLWRIYGDVQDSWNSVLSIIKLWRSNKDNFTSWGGPGHWNDPDMLLVGDYGLSSGQARAQLALWAMFAAPLMLSVDLRRIDAGSRALLQNPSVIALNQDPLGKPALVAQTGNPNLLAWIRQLEKGVWAVAILNTDVSSGGPVHFKDTSQKLGLPTATHWEIVDVFSGKWLGTVGDNDSFEASVPPAGGIWLARFLPLSSRAVVERRHWLRLSDSHLSDDKDKL